MRAFLLKKLLRSRVHEKVRGGHRLLKFLLRDMCSFPIQIGNYPTLYVDLSNLDPHAVPLFLANPLPAVPHEPYLTEVFKRLVTRSDTVFDIGANLGLHTLTFSQLAEQVIAFEPNPSLIPNLRKTILNIPNTRLIEVCLSDGDGVLDFHISEWNHMLGSMADWSGQPTRTVSVPSRSLDSLIEEAIVPMPDVIKVDVEGAEMMIFRGANKLFEGGHAPRAVIFEELNIASRKLGISDGAPAEYLKCQGYSLYLIGDNQIIPLPEQRPEAANLLALKGVEIGLFDDLTLS